MSLEFVLYVFFFIMTAYLIANMNISKIFKQGKILESKIFVIIVSMCVSYLSTSFVLNFLSISKIV